MADTAPPHRARLRLLALLVLGATLHGYSTGILGPGYATSGQGCGQLSCHGAQVGVPGGNGIRIEVVPSARSLSQGQAIAITTTVLGGATSSGPNRAGLSCEASSGRLVAGTHTRVGPTGSDLTHSDASVRTWSHGYVAPSTTSGPVDLWVVCNTVDGSATANATDIWAFHGADAASPLSTPVRFFVNAPGVVPFGAACPGAFAQVPVLGAPRTPTLGSTAFTFELVGAAPLAPIALLVGANASWQPVDLGLVNAPGCTLWVDPQLVVADRTGPGNASRAEGTASIAAHLPGDPALAGARLQAQIVILDRGNGRPLPLTLTNALAITLR